MTDKAAESLQFYAEQLEGLARDQGLDYFPVKFEALRRRISTGVLSAIRQRM